MAPAPQQKHGAALLVKKFFGITNNQEILSLPKTDREQLASSIARSQGMTQDQCEFPLVDY